jgi:C1A family cysteine protease
MTERPKLRLSSRLNQAPKGEIKSRLSTVPSSINWADKGKVGSVKDQGYCGSCWAFASAATAESYLAITNGTLYDLS